MAGIWPLSSAGDSESTNDGTSAPDPRSQAGSGSAPIEQNTPSRPPLHRDQPQPPPAHQPPPPPVPQPNSTTDSLSLIQLKRIVAEFPQTETAAYAFTYEDTATFEEETDEWFSYNDVEFVRLRRAAATFHRRWKKLSDVSWLEESAEVRAKFVQKQITGLQSQDLRRRCKGLQTILYITLGVWEESAGHSEKVDAAQAKPRTMATALQVQQMVAGMSLVADCGAVPTIYNILRNAFDSFWSDAYRESQIAEEDVPFLQDELDNVTTIMYLLIEGARNFPDSLANLREALDLNPKLVDYLLALTARLRWDDGNELPQTRIFLLFWKSCLLLFGGRNELAEVKEATMEASPYDKNNADIITASPLDYNVFRQEIISKYPAYVPPPSLIPLNSSESNSILPPLPNHPTRNNGSNGIIPPLEDINRSAGSILHQPVHIATPVPSPPPSPAVAGKAGKKQNYQTNQNFPFMYPPLDSSSGSAGGKGAASMHPLVGRKWEGSDVPASILEAGALFAGRMRMTRAMRQLWDERERFQKFERGWDESDELEEDIEELDLDELIAKRLNVDGKTAVKNNADYGPNSKVNETVKKRLDDLEVFYTESLPHLQSLVIVLLKAILANVTALISQPNGLLSTSNSSFNMNAAGGPRRPQDAAMDVSDLSVVDLEALRSREITAKAVSGILLTILKWFKISHVLKFEYLCQLLLDSNYMPLVLKLFAHQDVDRIVPCKADREQLSFFAFCNQQSKALQPQEDEGEDDAAPPPIKRNRDVATDEMNDDELPSASFAEGHEAPHERPEVDELGYPVNQVPTEPVTDFSWRNFFSSINFLRIMQKICKNKAHRNLLLVQYKSSNILKKALKIPQPELRLYTLKLFKNQVPYCGRKWRQSNMRVITAVYLHCRPELRDEWLAGSDVDAEVEESLPLEQALRVLTHWHNVKRYPDQMGADVKLLEEEHDFFVRELEKMDVYCDDGMDESQWESASAW